MLTKRAINFIRVGLCLTLLGLSTALWGLPLVGISLPLPLVVPVWASHIVVLVLLMLVLRHEKARYR